MDPSIQLWTNLHFEEAVFHQLRNSLKQLHTYTYYCVLFFFGERFFRLERRKINGGFCGYLGFNGRISRVLAMSSSSSSSLGNSTFKMNLNEYKVTLDKPLGIRFALSVDGKVFVHSLKQGDNAEKARIIMVGDTLKKVGESSGGKLIEIKDTGDAEEVDSFDMRKKLPFCVVLLLCLLKKNHQVYITCTTGFDRSPAYLV